MVDSKLLIFCKFERELILGGYKGTPWDGAEFQVSIFFGRDYPKTAPYVCIDFNIKFQLIYIPRFHNHTLSSIY